MALIRIAAVSLAAVCCAALAPVRAQCSFERAQLVAGDPEVNDRLGAAVAQDGDWVFAGAPNDSEFGPLAGAVYAYLWNGSSYDQMQKLVSDSPGLQGHFGAALDAENGLLAVGEPGRSQRRGQVHLFQRSGNTWVPSVRISSSLPVINKDFGASLALDRSQGDRLLIGSLLDTAEVFERQGNFWPLHTALVVASPGGGAGFGVSVDLLGDLALVGADDDSGGAGRAFLFERGPGGAGGTGGAGGWDQLQVLDDTSPEPTGHFGGALALSEGALAISRGGANPNVHLFAPSAGGAWAFETTVSMPGEQAFGTALDLDAGLLAVGSPFAFTLHVFARTSAGWSPVEALQSVVPGTSSQSNGTAVDLAGGLLVSGGPSIAQQQGRAFVYELPAGTVDTYCTAGTSASGCRALISAAGLASATLSSGFELTASGVEGDKQGSFYFGVNGRQANPWGNGASFQCVLPPVKRGGPLPKLGSAGACDGGFTQDLNALWQTQPSKNPGPGALVQAQLWYRDPASTSNQTTSLSNAVEFSVCP